MYDQLNGKRPQYSAEQLKAMSAEEFVRAYQKGTGEYQSHLAGLPGDLDGPYENLIAPYYEKQVKPLEDELVRRLNLAEKCQKHHKS